MSKTCWSVIAVLESGQGIGTCGHEHETAAEATVCPWTPEPWPEVCDLLVRQVRRPSLAAPTARANARHQRRYRAMQHPKTASDLTEKQTHALALIAGAGEAGLPISGKGIPRAAVTVATANVLRQHKLIELFEIPGAKPRQDQTWARVLPAGRKLLKAPAPAQERPAASPAPVNAAKPAGPAGAKQAPPRLGVGTGHRDPDNQRPPVGTILRRMYKGQEHRVTVTETGYRWQGQEYTNLSRIAKTLTGHEANGWRWFGLKPAVGRAHLSARAELDMLLSRLSAMLLAPTNAEAVLALAAVLEHHGQLEAAAKLRGLESSIKPLPARKAKRAA